MAFPRLFKRSSRYRPPDSRNRLARRLSSWFATTVSIFLIVCILGLLGWGGWTFYAFLFLSDYFEIRSVTIKLADDRSTEIRDVSDPYRQQVVGEIREICPRRDWIGAICFRLTPDGCAITPKRTVGFAVLSPQALPVRTSG
jgi:hypothetical protein